MPYTTIAQIGEVPQARAASDDLHAAGFPSSTISLVFPEQRGEELMRLPPATPSVMNRTGRGAIAELANYLPGTATSIIPGISRWLATGPILTILSGVGLRGDANRMVLALIGMGLSHQEANHFAEALTAGNILIAVRTDEESSSLFVAEILRRHGGRDISQSAWPRATCASTQV